MKKSIKKRSATVGLPPGEVVFVGQQKTDKVRITLFDYDEKKYQEKELKTVEECYPFKDKPSVTWINIDGLEDTQIIEQIDSHFEIHPLVLEDIVNTEQRPKLDDYEDYLFIVVKMLYSDDQSQDIRSEHVSLIVGQNYVISFQESSGGDIFNPIRDRIRNDKGRIRKMGADYLAYALIDTIVDNYFLALESLAEEIDLIETELMADADIATFRKIHALKRDMLFLHKAIWPLREVISGLLRTESQLIRKPTNIFLRDAYDHSIQVIDTVETFRDMLSGMLDVYMSVISNRMNEVMKFLTIISTIFIPLTFIAGIYGMNFKYMPELETHWGYFIILGIMLLCALAMYSFFKARKWI